MYNFSFPNFLYYPVPHFNYFGANFQPSFMVPVLPPQKRQEIIEIQQNEQIENQKSQSQEEEIVSSESVKPRNKANYSRPLGRSRRKSKKNKKLQKKSPEKNIFKNAYLSFAVHKLMYFINERYMTQSLLRELAERKNKSEEDIQRLVKTFYQQHFKVIKYVVNNCSIKRMRELWTGSLFDITQDKIEEQERSFLAFIYRALSKIYFQNYYTPFVLRSKKVKKMSLSVHLKMRAYLLKNMQKPEEFKSYSNFE